MRIEQHLEARARAAICECLGVQAPALIRPTQDATLGDYQLNGLLPLSKQLGKPAKELATSVLPGLLKVPTIASATVAGPGFINLTLAPAWIAKQLQDDMGQSRLGVTPADRPMRIVVDFSAPNIAKRMHVGHLRSTILGAALVKLLRMIGHAVIADNHIGDWGTQFGLLLAGMKRTESSDPLRHASVEALERIYQDATALAKSDASFLEEARAELAKLQSGDSENRSIWERLVSISRTELEQLYALLDVSFDYWLGESAYHNMLEPLVNALLEQGIAILDAGAICVFFTEPPELAALKTPLIVRKSDGAFLYATTDIATVKYRYEHFQAEVCLYVVDSRQKLHFKQISAVIAKLGLPVTLKVVDFGSILGADKKPLKTRDGGTIALYALLEEAQARAAEAVKEEGLDVSEQEMLRVARAVGIGAVKYADLRQNRLTDYQFDWDKMISFQGNAGPYLQYAYARVRTLFQKGGLDFDAFEAAPITLAHPSELSLAKQLLRLDEVVHQAAESYLPHVLCDHLYAVARQFSNFYQECPILKAAPKERLSRLSLAKMTALELGMGLELLGIEALERM
ncbi:MAG: arginine--tRNA ligase [Myxococcales bacterium]|nr:arginine--tRNA ligase [Myxococcales bacterium]